MSYREDGNFNIDWDWDGSGSGKQYSFQNSDFIFPDKGIRFLQAQAALDVSRVNQGYSSSIARGDFKLQRGYIRNLEQPQFGAVPITRCNFQFNPQQIQQNVSMREDVYVPMLQPPTQLAQPLGANVNFSFDLLFDRSHELAKGALENGSNVTADPNNIGPNDAYDIGVLADLRVFYSVIGQGFSKEMIDFQAKMFKYNYGEDSNEDTTTTTTDTTTDGTEGSETAEPPASPTRTATDSDILDLINSNIGNYALLMPMPVRVMFSSLFMVDGFVTGTTVDFLKFSTKMVPVQCRIGVTMNAMYIGFARKTTYITDIFKKAAEEAERRARSDAELREELLSALQLSCNTFLFGASYEAVTAPLIDWDKAKTLNHSYELPVWRMALSDGAISGYSRNLFLGFPEIQPIRGGDITLTIGGEELVVKDGADKDGVLLLYENGSTINFTYNWNITVWGRKPGVQGLPNLTYLSAMQFKNGTYTGNDIKILGSYSGTETSTSKEQWGSGTSGNGVKAERVRRRSLRGVSNTATDSYKADNLGFGPIAVNPDWGANSYFIIEVSVSLSASNGDIEPLTYSYTSKEVKKGDQDFDRRVTINWGSSFAEQTNPTYVTNPGDWAIT